MPVLQTAKPPDIRHEAPQHLLTIKEAAKFLRVHPSTLYRMLKRRTLPAFRVGSDWRIDARILQKLIDSGEGMPLERGRK